MCKTCIERERDVYTHLLCPGDTECVRLFTDASTGDRA